MDEQVEVEEKILDVYALNQADFIRLKDGTKIRMDRIVSVNGKLITSCLN
ncbi:MAG: hypothetical protein KME22_11380 [Hassallia sp. WJT32-NPBG1]|jgi:Rho-binding antiterminator|nr:hypothetical protein [Hassallia sp. WJT32-NPBG1]